MGYEFKPGDRIQFCGDEATVISNWGRGGIVRFDDGDTMEWLWVYDNEPVRLVPTDEQP